MDASMALLLPTSIAPLAGGALWGVLVGLLCRRAHSSLIITPAAYRQFSQPSRVELAPLTIAATLICLLSNAHGQQNAGTTATDDESTIHRVFVPVDLHGQPAGTKRFVDEEFLRQLLTKSAVSQLNAGRWLISNLKCEGKLRPQSDQRSAETSNWNMTLDVETFTRDTSLDLPFEKSQAVWPDVALVDGIPTPIVWNSNGFGCVIKVSEPGRHELAIQLKPNVRESNGRYRIELHVPPVTGAAFHIAYPAAEMAIAPRGGQFNEHIDPDGTKEVVGELDGSGKFSVEWSEQTSVEGTSAAAADEVSWLRIQRDSVDLDVRYILPIGVTLDSIVVAADPSLELIQNEGEIAATRIDVLSDGMQSIRIPTPFGSNEAHVVDATLSLAKWSFAWTGTYSVLRTDVAPGR